MAHGLKHLPLKFEDLSSKPDARVSVNPALPLGDGRQRQETLWKLEGGAAKPAPTAEKQQRGLPQTEWSVRAHA